jgi:hypothetical protein
MALVMAGRRPAPGGTTVAPQTRRDLWSADEFMRWVLAIGAGGIVIGVSWYVCAGDASFNAQIGPLDAAVAGLVLCGLGNVMWLMRGRRLLGERRRALLPDVVAAVSTGAGSLRPVSGVPVGAADAEAAAASGESALFVAGAGMVRFHRPDCALAAGRGWSGLTRAEHAELGRLPCGVCRP